MAKRQPRQFQELVPYRGEGSNPSTPTFFKQIKLWTERLTKKKADAFKKIVKEFTEKLNLLNQCYPDDEDSFSLILLANTPDEEMEKLKNVLRELGL